MRVSARIAVDDDLTRMTADLAVILAKLEPTPMHKPRFHRHRAPPPTIMDRRHAEADDKRTRLPRTQIAARLEFMKFIEENFSGNIRRGMCS